MMRGAKEHRAEDEERQSEVKLRNQSDSVVYPTGERMNENLNKIVAPETMKTADAIYAALELLKPGSEEQIQGAVDRLSEVGESLFKTTADKARRAGEALRTPGEEAREAYQHSSRSSADAMREADGYSIPPWYIASGIGSLDRRALCEFLAVFEETSLANVSLDGIRDLVDRFRKSSEEDVKRHFYKRIRAAADEYYSDLERSDAWLRFRIWIKITSAFGLKPSIPLSTGFANHRCCQVAEAARQHYEAPTRSKTSSEKFAGKMGRKAAEVRRFFKDRYSNDRRTFTQIVRWEATRHVAEALQGGDLTDDQRRWLEDCFRKKLDELPAELRDRALEDAVSSGDWATVSALGSGTSLVGLGVAVEIAGFSAYIVAAQASAIIPLLGAQTAVSLLAVITDPIFILLALSGGGYVIDHNFKKRIATKVASGLAVQLALQGLAGSADGLKRFLDDLKNLTGNDLDDKRLAARRDAVRSDLGFLPETPGVPRTNLPEIADMPVESDLNRILFPSDSSSIQNAVTVAGLTVADIVFDAAAIDPRVVSAADFTRAEDIEGIFSFGLFAERIETMGDIARAGAENQLRGYVAEMIVATRLSGHEVSLADNPNTAGYDLLVDGNPFQVKCYRDGRTAVEALDEHFASNPDIPVYLNSEALDAIQESGKPWSDMVFGVEGFDYEHTNLITEQSLEAGVDLMDVQIPLFAIAVSAARNIQGWWMGTIPLRDLPLEVFLDGTIHGALAIAGGYTAAGVGTLLFGPAGGVILGGAGQAIGVLAHGPLRRKVDDLRAPEWEKKVLGSCDALGAKLNEAMREKIRRVRSTASHVGTSDPTLDAWIRLKFDDRATCIAECKAELADLPDQTIERAKSLLRIMRESGVHPWSVKEQLKDLEETLSSRPSVTDQVKSAYQEHVRKRWGHQSSDPG